MGPRGAGRNKGCARRTEKETRGGKDGLSPARKGKVEGDDQTLGGLTRRTELRNRRYEYDSEYHLAPTGPWPDVPKSEWGSATPQQGKARRPSYAAISLETPSFGDEGGPVGYRGGESWA